MIKVQKTVYDKPEPTDGKRILVMKIWPRGISKGRVDVWMKDLGTPEELMGEWKSGKISRDKFAKEYRKSLKGKGGFAQELGSGIEKRNDYLLVHR